jgi:glycerol-3-phosphate dehydrogenase
VVVAQLEERLCVTRELPLHGHHHGTAAAAPLAGYGSDAQLIAGLMKEQPDLAVPLHPALPINGAQVAWAARHEMARTLDDVLARRTRALFLNARAAIAMAPVAARIMARELARDEAWERRQLEDFNNIAAGFVAGA